MKDKKPTDKEIPDWVRNAFENALRDLEGEGLNSQDVDFATMEDAVSLFTPKGIDFNEFEKTISPMVKELCRKHGIR